MLKSNKNLTILFSFLFILEIHSLGGMQIKPKAYESTTPENQTEKFKTLDEALDEPTNQIVKSLNEEKKSRIAVLEFLDLEGRKTNLGRFIAEELITKLYNTQKFFVIERQLLNKVLDEHKLSTTGIIDENSAKQLGKILGVDAIASGTISDLGNSIKLNSRLFATETGLIFAAAAVEILMNDAIQNLLEEGITDNQEEKNDNKDKFYYYNNGVYLLNANSFEEAEKKFLKAIQIDPEYDNAIYNLGVTYVKWGTEAFSKAKEEGRVDESYKEKYNRAIPYLEKVVAKDSENKQIWELLGKVYSVLGMEAEAKNAFNKSNQ